MSHSCHHARRATFMSLLVIIAGWAYQNAVAVPPQNMPPTFVQCTSFVYNNKLYVFGWINDQDDLEEDVVVSVSNGPLTGQTNAASSGYFILTFDVTGYAPPITVTVTATDPDDASTSTTTTGQ